jgi:hypothetical protein
VEASSKSCKWEHSTYVTISGFEHVGGLLEIGLSATELGLETQKFSIRGGSGGGLVNVLFEGMQHHWERFDVTMGDFDRIL